MFFITHTSQILPFVMVIFSLCIHPVLRTWYRCHTPQTLPTGPCVRKPLWLRRAGTLQRRIAPEGENQFLSASSIGLGCCSELMYRYCTACSRAPFVSISWFFCYHSSSVTVLDVSKRNKWMIDLIFITQTKCEKECWPKVYFCFCFFAPVASNGAFSRGIITSINTGISTNGQRTSTNKCSAALIGLLYYRKPPVPQQWNPWF